MILDALVPVPLNPVRADIGAIPSCRMSSERGDFFPVFDNETRSSLLAAVSFMKSSRPSTWEALLYHSGRLSTCAPVGAPTSSMMQGTAISRMMSYTLTPPSRPRKSFAQPGKSE